MKILIPNIEVPILHDVAQCLESIKERASLTPLLWNVQQKPLLDVFDEEGTDLLFLHTSQLDTSFVIAAEEFDFKYILVGDSIPKGITKMPEVILSTKEFVNHFPKGSNIIQITYAARIAQIFNATYDTKKESEVLVNTNHVEITPEIFELLSFLTNEYKVKIIGNTVINLHHYLGSVTMFERANFIKSTKVLVDLNSQECWDAAYLKIPAVCKDAPQSFLTFKDIKGLKATINNLLEENDKRKQYVDNCYREVCNGNTYYHLAHKIFKSMNDTSTAQHLEDYIQELIG
tara:strand:+ start:1466 stop:2332 length:867 start_codon:yes stop_codon:yes gene_type:complete